MPTPVVVAGDEHVEALIRAARGDIAKLSLELRALEHDAERAEQAATGIGLTADVLDLPAAQELLRSGVHARLATRRDEMRAEIDDARAAAAQRIRQAHADSAALIGAARDELLDVLGVTTRPPVEDGPAAAVFGRHVAVPEPPAWSEWAPNSPAPEPPVVAAPAPPGPAVAATAVFPIVTAPAPPAPPAVAAPAPAPVAPLVPPAPAAPAPHAASPMPGRRPPSLRATLLHADVLLPLIAVVIVFVVLLAWLA